MLQVRRESEEQPAAGPSRSALSSAQPLGLFIEYMDLAQISDPQAAVVVTASPKNVEVGRLGGAGYLGVSLACLGGRQCFLFVAFALRPRARRGLRAMEASSVRGFDDN